MTEASGTPPPLDRSTLPNNVIALCTLLLHREDAHAAELIAACNGLKEQVLCSEQLKLRLAKLLRERFGASSEKSRRDVAPARRTGGRTGLDTLRHNLKP